MMVNSNNNLPRDVMMDMLRILTKQRSGLNVCHINAQSLKNKIDEFRLTFENSGVDILCVSETWLADSIPDSLVLLRGYRVYRADRKTLGGGAAIFVRNGIKCKLLSKSSESEKSQYLLVEINANDKKLLICCVYRPYSNISLENVNVALETIAAEYNDVIVVGDFNSNLLDDSALKDNMAVFGLLPTNVTIPTHYTATNNTLLDVFFVNEISKVLLYDQISAPCFSKHDLIFLSYAYYLKSDNEYSSFRDFKNINYSFLQENISYIEWDAIYNMPSVDEQQVFLEDNIIKLYDLVVPIKNRIKRFNTRPWFNPKIKELIQTRNIAYASWKKFKSDSFRDDFKRARNEVNSEIKRAKYEYYSHRFSQALDSKGTWNIIKEIGHCNTVVSHDYPNSANEINTSFTSLQMVTPNESFYGNLFVHSGQNTNTFELACVNQCDVLSSCLAVRSNAIGGDNIDPKFVRIILPQILPYITYLFNSILTTSSFPSRWRYAKIIPIPKNRTEYRPIAILPFFSKVLEKLVHTQMNSYLNKFSLLTEHQSGFRPKHSCITALIDVAENIRCDVDQGKLELLVLLDHSKAFDTVVHDILYLKLKHLFNFSSTAILFIRSYLENRSQSVYLKNDISDPLPLNRGVPQGSILGPLLFSCYVNDLPQYLKHCKIHMYADDVQIYMGTSTSSVQDAVQKMNYDLQSVHDWATANGLSLNPLKSKCLVIQGRTRKFTFDWNIVLNGQRIVVVDSAKNLGVIFNRTLTWSNHVGSIVGATYNKLRALWSTQSFTPQRIRILLVKTYIMPTLLYGCEIFSSCDALSRRRLNVVFNGICRYVYGVHKYDHISNYNTRIYGVSLDNLFKIRVLLLLHKIIYGKLPSYVFDRLKFTRSSRGCIIVPVRHRTLVSDWQFYVNAIRLWNALPHFIQNTSSAARFKTIIYEHFSN